MINDRKIKNNESAEMNQMGSNQHIKSNNLVSLIRIRPMNKQETDFSNIDIIKIPNNNLINIIHPIEFDQTEKGTYYIQALKKIEIVKSKEYQYYFDKIYSEGASQEEVYSFTSYLLYNVINGFNATIMAYGATGTGKTYTIVGSGHHPGIMTRSISDLFMILNSNSTNKEFKVRMAYVELYNELILDLLSDQDNNNNKGNSNGNGPTVEIRNDPNKGLMFCGTATREIKNVSEAMQLLSKGNKKRTEQATYYNDKSSRSHGILQITVERDTQINNTFTYSKLLLFDLAGNEKVMTASILNKDGTSINKSLLALAKCINALIGNKSNNAFVSWRDSKLTQILRESLSGNASIIMIGTISSNIVSIEETMSTLLFVNKSMQLKLRQRKNEIESTVVHKIEKAIEELRTEISALKAKIAKKKYVFDHTPDDPLNQIEYCPELDIQLNNMKKHFDKEILLKKDILSKEKAIADLNFDSIAIKSLAVKGKDKDIKHKILSLEDKKNQIAVINIELENLYKIQSKLLIERKAYQKLIESISDEKNYDDNDYTIKERVIRIYRQCFMNLYIYYISQMKNMTLELNNEIGAHEDNIKDETINLLLNQLEIRDNAIQKSHIEILASNGALHEQNNYESYQEMQLNPCRLPIIDTGIIKLKHNIQNDNESISFNRGNNTPISINSPMLPSNIQTNIKAKYYQCNPKKKIKKGYKLNQSHSTSTIIQRINNNIFINNKLILKHDASLINKKKDLDENMNRIENKLKNKSKPLFRRDIIENRNRFPYISKQLLS